MKKLDESNKSPETVGAVTHTHTQRHSICNYLKNKIAKISNSFIIQKNKSSDGKVTIFSKICYLIVLILAIAFFALIGVLALKITAYFKVQIDFAGETSYLKSENIFQNILLIFLAVIAIYLVYKIICKININILLPLCLLLTMISGFWWVNKINFIPIADQGSVVECAEAFLDNKLEEVLAPGEYLNRNPHQLGIVLYIIAIFKITGTRSVIILQNINVIYTTLCTFLMFLISKKMFKQEKVQKLALLFITMFSAYWMFFDTYVYGNIPGLVFALLAIWLTLKYIENTKFYNLVLVALNLAIAYLLKSNYIIFLCAIIIVIFLHITNTRKIVDLLGIVLIIAVTVGLKGAVYTCMEKTTGYSFSDGAPMISYIYMGMAEPDTLAPGWYNSDVVEIYEQSGYDTEKAKELSKELIQARIEQLKNDTEYTKNYFYTKFQTTWLNPIFQTLWCSTPSIQMDEDEEYKERIESDEIINDILCGTTYEKIEKAMDIFEDIVFIAGAIGGILLLKKFDVKYMILPLTFLGGLIFHLIWETKSVYVLQYFYVVLPFTAYGLYETFTGMEKFLHKITLKRNSEKEEYSKPKIAVSIVFIALCVVGATTYLYNNYSGIVVSNTEEVIEETANVVQVANTASSGEWYGNYIWNNTNDDNTWMCFRKTVTLTKEEAENVVAQVAVDSKYWLYINGELIIRDGALKRGEKEDSIYYDELDLSKYFNEGENTIAILAWYWGGQSFSHISSGQAGMMFQAKVGDTWIITDDTWKVAKHESYLQDGIPTNYRLIEYNIYYDANLWNEDWYQVGYDDSNWENATVLNIAGSLPWGELIKRETSQYKYSELKEYENSADYIGYTTTENMVLELKLPYNTQLTPYLKVMATSGIEINMYTDTYNDASGASIRCSYITKEGEQEFECLEWINGEIVYYVLPEGVTILELGYRETGYDTELTGSFTSDDEFFNELWTKAQRTLYVNMRDSYMDCPNRERAQWAGDMNLSMMEAMYALDTNAYELYEKGIKTMLGWSEDDVLYTVSPNNLEPMNIPAQVLGGIVSMYEYYEYTGKAEFLEEVYPYVKAYLELWDIDEATNLIVWTSDKNSWNWADSTAENDYTAVSNAWYYYALTKNIQMAEILGYNEDVPEMQAKLEKVYEGFNRLWTESGYKTEESTIVDERANALAVLVGLADESKYEVIKTILTTDYQATPYMEKYVLEALCYMGEITSAQERIKIRYADMVTGENAVSTLWESWNLESGTQNHAWSGGPLIIMSKYFAGIEPLKAGYEEISIKPNFGTLTQISTTTTTIQGDITLEAKKTEKSITINIDVPTKTLLAVPKIEGNFEITVDNEAIYSNGQYSENEKATYEGEDEEYVYFYVDAGEYSFFVE